MCWPCGAAAPLSPPAPSGPVAFAQVSADAIPPERPTLNLHVTEPNETPAAQALSQAHIAVKKKLAQLELRRLELKERMASRMASVTEQMDQFVTIARDGARTAKSVAFLSSKVLPVDAYKIRS